MDNKEKYTYSRFGLIVFALLSIALATQMYVLHSENVLLKQENEIYRQSMFKPAYPFRSIYLGPMFSDMRNDGEVLRDFLLENEGRMVRLSFWIDSERVSVEVRDDGFRITAHTTIFGIEDPPSDDMLVVYTTNLPDRMQHISIGKDGKYYSIAGTFSVSEVHYGRQGVSHFISITPEQELSPYHVWDETLHMAHQAGIDYRHLVSLARRGNEAALHQLINLDIFDAAGGLGHGVVIYDIKYELGERFFNEKCKSLTDEQKIKLERLLEIGAGYSHNAPKD